MIFVMTILGLLWQPSLNKFRLIRKWRTDFIRNWSSLMIVILRCRTITLSACILIFSSLYTQYFIRINIRLYHEVVKLLKSCFISVTIIMATLRRLGVSLFVSNCTMLLFIMLCTPPRRGLTKNLWLPNTFWYN